MLSQLDQSVNQYYDGLNQKLLEQIPDCRKVLELGCSAGLLGAEMKRRRPGLIWHGVEVHQPSIEKARLRLDHVFALDIESGDMSAIDRDYDCIVIGDCLEHLRRPEEVLTFLQQVTTSDASIICCVPNGGHISILERILTGDLTYDDAGLLDSTHLRMFSQSSLFKTFLDAGWAPNLESSYDVSHPNRDFENQVYDLARSLRVSRESAKRYLNTYQMVVSAGKISTSRFGGDVSVSVIVPVNDWLQYSLNVGKSPGLSEIGAEIIPITHATSASDAFERGRASARGEWLLFCHQDVYFPKTFGRRLAEEISRIPVEDMPGLAVGFAGIGLDESGDYYAGHVIDRTKKCFWRSADRAISIDEICILVHSSTVRKIDPSLGWHLWGTDLCLTRDPAGEDYPSRILQLPIFHNSHSDYNLPDAFHKSLSAFFSKHVDRDVIVSTCGRFMRS